VCGKFVSAVLATHCPHSAFTAVDRQFATDSNAMFNVEARTAELCYPRRYFDHITEFHGLQKIGPDVHKWKSDDAKNFGNVLPPNAECGLEKHPSIGVKALKKTTIEHDASWVALSRVDGHLPAENERGQNDAPFASFVKF
jgi:hypothetical protein